MNLSGIGCLPTFPCSVLHRKERKRFGSSNFGSGREISLLSGIDISEWAGSRISEKAFCEKRCGLRVSADLE